MMKRAALGAALFVAGCSSAPVTGTAEKPLLKAADERSQRLYDQAVKLHRRYAGQAKPLAQPLKSILTELSLYHEEDLATYLSDMGAEGKRSGPIEVAPWATARLARLDVQLGDLEGAAEAWHDLKERFAGRMVIEPADGPNASKEKAEPAGLCGEIAAFIEIAKQGSAKDLLDTVAPKIELLQANFGSDQAPCQSGECPSYSRKALSALWEALELEKADYKAWRNATLKFAKREASPDFKAVVLCALAQGERKLGKLDDARGDYAGAAISSGLPEGIFKNLIQP